VCYAIARTPTVEPRMAKKTPDTPQPPAAEEQASRYHVTPHVDSVSHQTRNFHYLKTACCWRCS
jgi:hypothetical protein